MVQLLEPLAPPGQFDRSQRRLGGSRDDIRHRIVNVEQGIEGGPELRRPVQPDEIAVALRRVSDR